MVRPTLSFVNFFREKRGRRVVEVKDIIVPDDAPRGWPRHHMDFEDDLIYRVKWPHIPVEGSFSTESEYDAKILCFGVTIEDLIHEAKSTGCKIPSCDVEKFQNPEEPKVESPDGKMSVKGRRLRKSAPLAPAPPPCRVKRKKKQTAEEKERRARNSDFINTLNLPFPDTDAAVNNPDNKSKKDNPQTLSGKVMRPGISHLAEVKPTENTAEKVKSPTASNSNSRSTTKVSLKSISARTDDSPKKAEKSPHKKSKDSPKSLSGKVVKPGSPVAQIKPTENEIVMEKHPTGSNSNSSSLAKGSLNFISAGAGALKKAVKNPANESKNESQRSFSGKETKSASHLAQIKSTDKKIDNENKASGSFMERIRRQNTVMNVDTKKKTKSKKRRIKEMISSSEDEETMSNVSNADSAESRTQIYVTKIQKLELELKKLKRENLALKERDLERSLCSKKSPSTPNTPSISVSASSSAKRSLFNSSSANCDYADNTTISQMIVDAYEKKAPLRKDGAGKVHLGNGVYVSAKLFEDKLMASKVSPSIATRDLLSQMYSNKELAERSLDGGTPVKGGPDRKKLKKKRLTPAKKECLFGLFRAKTQINSGSSDKNFLDLSVEKKGKATIRDKLKEAARKFRVEADAKATRTAEVMDSSQDTDADSEMGSKRDEFHLDDGKERSEGSNDKEEDASDVTQLNLDDAEMHSPRDSQTDADDAEMGSGSCSEANSQEDDESDVASKQQDAEVLSQSSRDSVDDMDNLL